MTIIFSRQWRTSFLKQAVNTKYLTRIKLHSYITVVKKLTIHIVNSSGEYEKRYFERNEEFHELNQNRLDWTGSIETCDYWILLIGALDDLIVYRTCICLPGKLINWLIAVNCVKWVKKPDKVKNLIYKVNIMTFKRKKISLHSFYYIRNSL